jgi:hypothetical protein
MVDNLMVLRKFALGLLTRSQRGKRARTMSAAKLKLAEEHVRQVSAALEADFFATGTGMENLAKHGDEFVRVSEHLLNSATGRVDGTGLFAKAVQVLQKPLNFLNDSQAKTQALLSRLKLANDRIDEFISIQADLQRTIAPLKFIQTLFKIESAPLGEQVQTMFGALTNEIEQLHDQVCNLFTTKFLELREIQCTVNQVIFELKAQTDQLWQGISREKSQIEQSISQLQEELLKNQEREPRISRVGKEVNQDIQQIVMGLQFQDIISQKIQHTGTALRHIMKLLENPGQAAGLGKLCQLEVGQLQAIRKEIASAENIIKTGMQNVLDRIVKADTQCLTLTEFQQLTTSADGMVEILFDVFGTLRKQIASTVANSGAAYEKLRPIGGLASDLTVEVRDLSQRIHLIGLNAQVQAAQVGHGVALEVLSARTSEISRATTQISEDVAKHLDQLVQGLADSVKELEALQQEALSQQKCLANEGATTEKNLHALRDDALTSLQRLSTLLDNIRDESQSLIGAVDFVGISDTALEELIGELNNLAEIATMSEEPATPDSEAVMRELQKGYTMNSQRDVFASVVAGVSVPSVADRSGAELFSDPSPETVPVASTPVELASPHQSETEPLPHLPVTPVVDTDCNRNTPATAATENFGSNAELF